MFVCVCVCMCACVRACVCVCIHRQTGGKRQADREDRDRETASMSVIIKNAQFYHQYMHTPATYAFFLS